MTFSDRTTELERLAEAYDDPGHAFVVVYGRRRVGKTALVREFCSNRPHVYYLAAQETAHRQLEKFVDRIAEAVDERPPRIADWPDAFDYLGEVVSDDPFVVVMDEFPSLVEANDALPSYLQSFVDERLPETDSVLVLCGSSVGVMESEVLGHESPLYGRRTAQIDLQPFTFTRARAVIDYDLATAVESFSITGGTPMYLTRFDYRRPLGENVRAHVLDRTSVLYNEPEFLLRTELRSPGRYMSILEAIATGHTTPNEISGATHIDPGPLSKYLVTLRRLRLVDREMPVTETTSKRSRYRIGDEFLRFWFRYVEPHRSAIEEAPDLVYTETIQPDLTRHASATFESVCREAVWEAIRRGILDRYSAVGRWWYGGEEIDVVGLGPREDRLLVGECKWSNEPVGHGLVEDLREKVDHVRWGPADRGVEFGIFSKAGFVDGLAADLDERWHLFSLDDLDPLLRPS